MASDSQRPRDDAAAHGMMMLAVSWFGAEDMVQALVREEGVAVDVADAEGRTPLMLVLEDRHVEAARWLIDVGANVNAVNRKGTTPLMYAAKGGIIDTVKLLVESGADVNARNQSGLTPLTSTTFRACEPEVVRFLVEHGADVNPPLVEGVPLLERFLQLWYYHEQPDLIRFLVDAGADVNAPSDQGETVLMSSAGVGDLDYVRYFIGAGANVNAADCDGWTALMFAAQSGSLDIVRCLVDAGAAINTVATDKGTPMLRAAIRWYGDQRQQPDSIPMLERIVVSDEQMDIIRYFIANGAEVNVAIIDGRTVLMLAAARNRQDIQFLLDAGADVNALDVNGRTPLVYAASSSNLDAVRCLVEAGADVNLAPTGGSTPLMQAARSSNVDLVEYLIDEGADVNAVCRWDGSTALICACDNRNFDGVRLLVDAGADVNARDANGDAPLLRATMMNNVDAVRLLVEAGADVNSSMVGMGTPLIIAARRSSLDVVKILVSSGANVDATSDAGMTALMHAVWADKSPESDVVAFLISAGADVNLTADNGSTPLMHALSYIHDINCVKTIKLLLDAGANPNAAREDGRTALMDAAKQRTVGLVELELVQVLIEYGADPSQADQRGRTPLFFAAKHGQLAVQHFLARCIVRSPEMKQKGGISRATLPSWTTTSWFIPPFEVAIRTAHDLGEYKAKWLDADVKLKLFILSASVSAFEEEVGSWYQLRHPNVIKLYGACNIGHHFFVCEFTPNGSLTEYLAACDKSGTRRTPWKFLHESAVAVSYLHQRQIVHGNLRPEKILVGSDMVAKLSDFGLSGSIGSANGAFALKRWYSPEQLKGGPASMASDIYSLGLCIFEVITGKVAWNRRSFRDGQDWDPYTHPEKEFGGPGPMPDNVRFLVARMCGQSPQTRLEASGVVQLLERQAAQEGIEYLSSQPEPEPNLSVDEFDQGRLGRVWSKLCDFASQDSDHELPLVVIHDLEAIYKRLSSSRNPWTLLHRFQSLLEDLERTFAVGSRYNRILRLSSTRATSGSMESFRRRIDAIWALLDCSQDIEQSRKKLWEEYRKEQIHVFVSEVSRTLLVMNEMGSEEDRIAFLTLLKGEMETRKANYSASQLAVMQQAYDDLERQAGSEVLKTMPAWFLPWYELMIDTANWLGDGGFGSVYRAKWLDSDVVVKQVKTMGEANSSYFFSDATTATSNSKSNNTSASVRRDDATKQKLRRMFESEVDIWFSLSHPNVVRLFGACHVGTPFFACEYASNGSLDKYLRSRPDEIWRKLYEAALGIQYLHARGIIHGDLKCNNIVVGSDGLAKVTDFGLSSSADLTGKDTAELTGAWHWVAPECLERGVSAQTTASDVYAFGMCVLEAVRVVEAATGKKSDRAYVPLPWGHLDNAVVKHYVVREQKLPLRPRVCSDAQWTLVTRMCRHDPLERLKISAVVDELAKLAERDAIDEPEEAIKAFTILSQPSSDVIADMKRRCSLPDASSSEKEALCRIYSLLWGRIQQITDNELGGAARLHQLIERASSATRELQDAEDSLVEFTENALRGYALHRDLDKLIDASHWHFDAEEARVHDWKAKCYEFIGVTRDDEFHEDTSAG